MKLKCQPGDFQVEELASLAPGEGRFALYRLTKRSLGTLEAVRGIARRWKIPPERFSYGGLKDRHALTRQYLSIEGGPRRDLRQAHFHLRYLGQVAQAFTSTDIAGNRFRIVLRDLSAGQMERLEQGLQAAARDGVPNYFDRQRFGCVGSSGHFVARPWCQGDFQHALWLALADPSAHDSRRQKADKRYLREHWGDWAACAASVCDSQVRRVLLHLERRGGDFRGGFARIDPALRRLYLAAFQSHVWNRMLGRWLQEVCPSEDLFEVPWRGPRLIMYRQLDEATRGQLAAASLPLPSARLHLEEGPIRRLVTEVVGEMGLELRQMRVKYPRDSFFSKGWRHAIFFPEQLRHESLPDELHPGRRKLTLRFLLPRGSYATLLIRRIAVAEVPPV